MKTPSFGESSCTAAASGLVEVRGAREHNLKDVDVSIPRNALVVFSGISGSGKSSLAFGTIYAGTRADLVASGFIHGYSITSAGALTETAGGDINVGNGFLFPGLAAVIVGGTMMGGRGDYLRTCLGALIVTALNFVISVLNITSQGGQSIINGALILLVVAFYGRERRLRDRV